MFKRNVAILALVILFVFSVASVALMSDSPSVSGTDDGGTILAMHRIDLMNEVHDPQCPGSGSPGCGGG
ncbi:MAG: hypothetical protein JW966_11785 [Anaerolineae bacterium]|nr:hypothetical protein [Anaerolineae bacterium]